MTAFHSGCHDRVALASTPVYWMFLLVAWFGNYNSSWFQPTNCWALFEKGKMSPAWCRKPFPDSFWLDQARSSIGTCKWVCQWLGGVAWVHGEPLLRPCTAGPPEEVSLYWHPEHPRLWDKTWFWSAGLWMWGIKEKKKEHVNWCIVLFFLVCSVRVMILKTFLKFLKSLFKLEF